MKLTKTQALSEYAICLVAILSFMYGMQIYVKRGLAGRYQDVVDHVPNIQHDPFYTEEKFDIEQSSNVKVIIKPDGVRKKTYVEDSLKVSGESLQKTTYSVFDDLRLPGLF